MKEIKKALFSVFIATIFLLTTILVCIQYQSINVLAIAPKYYERKIYSDLTLDDEFCDSSIIVVLDKYNSNFKGIEKKVKDKLSGVIEMQSIKDLTAFPDNYMDGQNNIDINEAPQLAEYYKEKSFRQILHIELKEKGKQNVLNAIKRVEKIEGVRYVGPDRIFSSSSVTVNDSQINQQWALDNIEVQKSWDITTGLKNIRIGVIDSGIASHDNLYAKWIEN